MKKFTTVAMLIAGVFAGSANAALMTTSVQTQTYSGPAGNTSGISGVQPFTFAKFDPSLGTLIRVVSQLTFEISGGLLSVDNITNKVVSGNGSLGASVEVTGPTFFISDAFQPMFSGFDLSQMASFTLAADPTLSVGGSGPDVANLFGGTFSMSSGWLNVASFLHSSFMGSGNFDVNFDTNSDISLNVVGARGTFEAVNTNLTMNFFYEYESATPPAPVSVGYGLGSLVLAGLVASRRRKQK